MADTAPRSSAFRKIRSSTFAALGNSGFRRYYLGQGISLTGSWLQAAAVLWLVYEQSESEFMLGVVQMASVLPGLFVGLFAGAMADRITARRMIIVMECAQMALAFLLAALVWLRIVQMWQMATILAIARVCVTFELPSRQVFFYELVGPEILSNAIALNSGLFNATRVLGPALAGVGLEFLGATGCFALNGASFIAAIAAVISIRHVASPRPLGQNVFRPDVIFGGLGYLRSERRILTQFTLVAFFGFIAMGYEAMVPAYATRIVRTNVGGYSLLMACSGIGATVGALVVASLGGMRRKERLSLAGDGDLRHRPGVRGIRSHLAASARRRSGFGFRPGAACTAHRGLRRRALLFLVDDAYPACRARSAPRPDHGNLDDRLFGLGPAGRPLDRVRRQVVGSGLCDGAFGRDLHRDRVCRDGSPAVLSAPRNPEPVDAAEDELNAGTGGRKKRTKLSNPPSHGRDDRFFNVVCPGRRQSVVDHGSAAFISSLFQDAVRGDIGHHVVAIRRDPGVRGPQVAA